jgi:flagellar hook-length control protein FliK
VWEDAFSQKMVFLSNAHQHSAQLTLNPPDLGPLQVVLQVTENRAHALFVSQHPQVREAVEAALPNLRQSHGRQRYRPGQPSVSERVLAADGPQQQGSPGRGRGCSLEGWHALASGTGYT